MIRWLDTLVARSVLVSLIGITLVHALSLWSYEHALDRELTLASEMRLAERLVSIKRSVMLVAAAEREPVAHDLSGGPIEAHWGPAKATVIGRAETEQWRSLIEQIRLLAPELKGDDVAIGASAGGDPHVALISMKLPDDSWINVSLFAAGPPKTSGHGTLLSTSLMAFGVVLLSLLVARWLTRPLQTVVEAVGQLTPGRTTPPVPEVGPREVRDLASAFNAMQRRINDLVDTRTLALAAVSHDLRTPLTRVKLRAEDIPDEALRSAVVRDIGEMEQMIEATLSYLRGEASAEPQRGLDLVAVLRTIVEDARETGQSIELEASAKLIAHGRLIGLKRAFGNLIGNATRYGQHVRVTAQARDRVIIVSIDDDGPGIPDDQLKLVLEPFVRLEASRNRDTGGVGLGLSIAKANIEADGGTLTLSNRAEGGLRATISLPTIGD